jgi:hypothetical protein
MLGIARRFLDEAKQILLSKNDVSELNGLPKALQITFKDTKLEFDKAKEALYKTVEHSWRKLQKYGALDEEWANEVSAQSRQSCKTALRCVQDLYPHLGMSDINPDSIIY